MRIRSTVARGARIPRRLPVSLTERMPMEEDLPASSHIRKILITSANGQTLTDKHPTSSDDVYTVPLANGSSIRL